MPDDNNLALIRILVRNRHMAVFHQTCRSTSCKLKIAGRHTIINQENDVRASIADIRCQHLKRVRSRCNLISLMRKRWSKWKIRLNFSYRSTSYWYQSRRPFNHGNLIELVLRAGTDKISCPQHLQRCFHNIRR